MADKAVGDLFDVRDRPINVVPGTAITLTRWISSWYFSTDKESISYGRVIGLPMIGDDNTAMLFLPICYRRHYEETCSKHGIKLIWGTEESEKQ